MPVTINGTTGIAGVDGSAGTPSVQGTDTNTGMFFPAADTIAFSAGGTEDLRIGPAGQIGIQGANYGTSGQVFTSGGASAAPSWTTISVSPSGLLIRAPRILTSGTSYTTPSNCTAIYVELWGAGGSGGRGNSGSGGGGSGAYCAKYATVTGSTAYTIAIGSGGAAPTSNSQNGNTGGSTTITIGATTYTAGGGGGGNGNAADTGGSGGTATNGDINISGQQGGFSKNAGTVNLPRPEPWGQYSGASGTTFSGNGGSTVGPLACPSGGRADASGAPTFYGAGSGGVAASVTANAGFQGLIRIWEYT